MKERNNRYKRSSGCQSRKSKRWERQSGRQRTNNSEPDDDCLFYQRKICSCQRGKKNKNKNKIQKYVLLLFLFCFFKNIIRKYTNTQKKHNTCNSNKNNYNKWVVPGGGEVAREDPLGALPNRTFADGRIPDAEPLREDGATHDPSRVPSSSFSPSPFLSPCPSEMPLPSLDIWRDDID